MKRIMRCIVKYLVEISTTVLLVLGGIFLALAGALCYCGIEYSRQVQATTEQLGKGYAGGGWYPAYGTDYDLEMRIVGQEGWVTRAINVERGDQVEVRLRIASSEEMPKDGGVSAVFSSAGLEPKSGITIDYDSPNPHVAYVPIGIYQVEEGWLHEAVTYSVGVSYKTSDKAIWMENYIVPPYSELDLHIILRVAIIGVVCLIAAAVSKWLRYRFG